MTYSFKLSLAIVGCLLFNSFLAEILKYSPNQFLAGEFCGIISIIFNYFIIDYISKNHDL